MKNEILLSVIIPCYNAEKYIKECADSLTAIEDERTEFIFVDDGSADSTYEILSSYTDKRITVIKKENKGPSSARNSGLKKASGNFIMFVDADDYVFTKEIEKVIFSLEDCFELVYFRFSDSGIKEKENTIKQLPADKICRGILNIDEKFMQELRRQNYNFHSPWAKLYKRSIIIEKGIYFPENLRWGEDICFNLSYLRYVKEVQLFSVTGYFYRYDNQSLINGYYPDKRRQMEQLVQEAVKYIDGEECKEAYQYFVARQYLYIFQEDLCHPMNRTDYHKRKETAWEILKEIPEFNYAISACSLKKMGKQPAFLVWLVRRKLFGIINLLIKFKLRFSKK